MKLTKMKPYLLIITYCALMVLLILNFSQVMGFAGSAFSILKPFMFGFVLAFILNRPYMALKRYVVQPAMNSMGVKKESTVKTLSIVLVYALLFGLLSAFVSFVLPQLGTSIMDFASNLPSQLETFGKQANVLIVKYNVESEIIDIFNKYWAQMLTGLSNALVTLIPTIANTAMSITTGISNAFVGLVVSIYMLINKDKLINQVKKLLYAFVPQRTADYISHVGKLANKTFGGFLTGQLIVSLIVGILCFTGMTIFKMPYALLASVVVGVTNVIPYFGPIIGAVPGTLIILITEPIKALWFVLMIVVIQQFDGNFMSPKIVGSSIGLSGMWVLFSILVGGGLFGVAGMVIGLPSFAVIYALLREATHGKLIQKGKTLAEPEKEPQ